MNYYCLVAGLPDIHAEDNKGLPSPLAFREELEQELKPRDLEMLRLLNARHDNANLLSLLRSRDAALNPLGNLTAADWEQLLALMQETDTPRDTRILPYINTFYQEILNDELDEKVSKEDYLAGLYYDFALKTDNEFLHGWFTFNLDLTNILLAITCRKYHLDTKHYVIGNNEVAKMLRVSNARDFGLTGTFDQLEAVIRISEESDLAEREKKIDALKWAWLDEHVFFHYFSAERVLAYALKLEMLDRWRMLSVDKGTEVFRKLLADLKQEVKIMEL